MEDVSRVVSEKKIKAYAFTRSELLRRFYAHYLPFSLTSAQKRVIVELHADMKDSEKGMQRLLQGDVGSGKTLVAWMCLLLAFSNDTQGALMAPTEILASQHYEVLRGYASSMGLVVMKLVGSMKSSAQKEVLSHLEQGKIDVLVGTHALLEKRVVFYRLGLVIIDEQHRFGVAQRAQIILNQRTLSQEKSKEGLIYVPHILLMSATPIPRSLLLTSYGELAISVLDELPKGHRHVRTVHRKRSAREKVYAFMGKELQKGHRAYIVYPLIEESEKIDLTSLMEGFEEVSHRFKSFGVEMLHGRMSTEEKRGVMARFSEGKTQVLVATTVIEVGIHVPAATMMLVIHAERYGLAQLHQLRGRIGRNAEISYCILMTEGRLSAEAQQRIDALCEGNDGFALAELDLALRGPGNIMGKQQSGLLKLRLADLHKDMPLMERVRAEVRLLLEKQREDEALRLYCDRLCAYAKRMSLAYQDYWQGVG